MTALEVAFGALAVALLGVLLHTVGYSGARLLSLLGVASVYIFTVGRLESIFSALVGAVPRGETLEVVEAAIAMVGFGYLFGMVADMLRTLGQAELASGLEVAGRVEIFALSLPYLSEILDMALGFIGGGV